MRDDRSRLRDMIQAIGDIENYAVCGKERFDTVLGREYPLTHDISALLDLLESSGEDVKRYWDLIEYNVFAVRFRYESLEVPDEPLDRAASVRAIEDLMGHVDRLLESTFKE